jgi:hypothetical protein
MFSAWCRALPDHDSSDLFTAPTLTDLRTKHGYDSAPIEDVDRDGELGPQRPGRESADDANPLAETRHWLTVAAG